jgi:hypothetical protein
MKKVFINLSFTSLFLLAGCTKDLTTKNVDPINPNNVPSYTLFTSAQRVFTNNLTSSNVNLNIFRLIVQYWQETTYTDESNYDITTRGIPDEIWDRFYRDVLQDFNRAKTLYPTDASDPKIAKNETAITDVMMVYTYYYLLTTYGNIPYSQALNIDNQFPAYDDAKTVYTDLLKRLNDDISALDPSAESLGSADIFYGGDVAAWQKFSNSLKLKMGMLIADEDPATAKTTVESAVAAGVFESITDNALFTYLANPPGHNPVWEDLVQSGRKDFVANSTVIDTMKSLSDPRLPYYFTFDANGDYSGGDPGASSNYATFSKPSGPLLVSGSIGKITNPDFPGDVLDYSEVEFLLAEAVERGFNVGGTAEEHYNAGIVASILYWNGSTTGASDYLERPGVNYATAQGDWKQKIAFQKWLALYNRGWDAWIEVRRLDYPKLELPAEAVSGFPNRFTYPVNEQNINTAHYKEAIAPIGKDLVTTKLFWDIH